MQRNTISGYNICMLINMFCMGLFLSYMNIPCKINSQCGISYIQNYRVNKTNQNLSLFEHFNLTIKS